MYIPVGLVVPMGPTQASYYPARLIIGCFKARTASTRACPIPEGPSYGAHRVHIRFHIILWQQSRYNQYNS